MKNTNKIHRRIPANMFTSNQATTKQFSAIMFADIAGSTRIYSQLGDSKAEQLISNQLAKMGEITKESQGRVIKTIGDEIMCQFPDATNAALAAIKMQQQKSWIENGLAMNLRIGLHIGDTVVAKDGDIFGDAVNMSARMTSIAKAKQIITTESFIQHLNNHPSIKTRFFDKTHIKGFDGDIEIHQILWELDDATDFAIAPDRFPLLQKKTVLSLAFHHKERFYSQDNMEVAISIGRDDNCDIPIYTQFVSRSHLQLEFRREKFVLIDHSTNGTYIQYKHQQEIFLRREELPLIGEGSISLGESNQENHTNNLYFKVSRK